MAQVKYDKLPLFGPDSADDSPDVNSQLTQNMWPKMRVVGARNIIAMYGVPGLSQIGIALSGGPLRGNGVTFNGYAYLVIKNKLIQIDIYNAVTEVGTFNTTSGRIEMRAGRAYILAVDGIDGYAFDGTNFFQVNQITSGTSTNGTTDKLDVTGETFITKGATVGQLVFNTTDGTSAEITALDSETVLSIDADIFSTASDDYAVGDPDFPSAPSHVTHLGGYFTVNKGDTDEFYITTNEDPRSVSALDFESAAEKNDNVFGVESTNKDLYIFGNLSTQVYWHSGDPDFPFTLYQGAVLEFGVAAAHSIVSSSAGIFLLATAKEGGIFVVNLLGFTSVVISNDIADDLKDFDVISDAEGYVYRYSDKTYYQLSFPAEGRTFEYIVEDQFWVERKSYNIGRHLSSGHVFFNRLNIIGNHVTGEIYKIDGTVFTEDGNRIERIRRTQNINKGWNSLIFHELVLVIEAGVGTVSGSGLNPQVAMRYSDDGGHNWSSWLNGEMGALGKKETQCYWTKLGLSETGRTFEFKVTDPVKTVFVDAFARVTVVK